MENYINQNLEDILKAYKAHKHFFLNSQKLMTALNDDLLSLMEKDANKFSGDQAKRDNKDRALAVNYFKKIIDHKSQIYTFPVSRTGANAQLAEKFSKIMNIKKHLHQSNRFYNASKTVLLEIYQDRKNNLKVRPLSNDKFFVWSDDIIEPNKPTVYVKIIGSVKDGRSTEDRLHIWTDTEFMDVLTNKRQIEYSENEWGVAPFVYINTEDYSLMPVPSRDTLQNIIQINAIFTNANVCSFYQGHPIRILKNVDKENSQIPLNPSDFMVLNGRDGSGLNPELDEIASSLDVQKAIALAKELLEQTLYINNIKAKDAVSSNQSGISLQLKDSDIVEDRKAQIENFKPAEEELWTKIAIIHNKNFELKQLSPTDPSDLFVITPGVPVVEVEFTLPDTNTEIKKEEKQDLSAEKNQGE